MRSSYPATPRSAQQSPNATQDGSRVRSPLPNLPDGLPTAASSSSPVIPVNLIDAPSQRMYTFAVYGLLLVWRIYDWWQLVEEETTSIGLFLKWSAIDSIFLFGVPYLRIPWLEWSETTSIVAGIVHAVLNIMLMFRVPVSLRIPGQVFTCPNLCSSPLKDGCYSWQKRCSTEKCPFLRTASGRQASCTMHLS